MEKAWIDWRHDRYTNFVYISDKLKEFYPDAYNRLTALFNDMGIDWGGNTIHGRHLGARFYADTD